jgi:hypothetical protein
MRIPAPQYASYVFDCMQQTAHPLPICQKCNTPMDLHGVTPCAEGYDMWRYGCLDCRGAVNMVDARTAESASISERRLVARHPVITTGTIEVSGGLNSCIVRDVSAAGAGLSGRADTPEHFTLIADGSRLPCHVVWRREDRIGVAFD